MGGDPDWLALAGGYVYVAADTLHLLDGTTGADQGRVNIGGSICLAMDVGFDSLWVPSCGESPSVTRVDPTIGGITATIPIDAIDLQPEGSVAAGAGGVWVITAPPNQVLVRIDPAANAVAGSFSLPTTVDAVRASDGALWITSANGGSLLHVDPDSGEVIATIPIGGAPRFLAVGEGGVWVMDNLRGAVVHVNPTTDTIVATIDVGGRVDGGDIAVGGGYVWARVTDGLLVQIDPATDRVVARYGPASGSGSVAADDTAVWVSAHDVSTIWRLPLGN